MDDLKYLKKHFGEKFSHLCRELFPTILENEGELSKIISDHFAPTRSLYDDLMASEDIEDFKNYIYYLFDERREKQGQGEKREVAKPVELLDKAGYILYPECQTEEEIQSFRKYYRKDEELCTFRWGDRLNTCRVWFAVKKNVDEIKRENFINPQRQDEYGTSVLSIQFRKGNVNTLSIKNRYNHTVTQPDSTFSNNLDNIISGLTQSFTDEYNLNITNQNKLSFELENYVLANNRKFYRYTLEENDIYYCENNVVIKNGNPITYDKSRYLLIENYLFDKEERRVINLINADSPNNKNEDAFINSLGEIEKFEIVNIENEEKLIKITPKKNEIIEIKINQFNQFISIFNSNVTEIGDSFLNYNKSLKVINLPKAEQIGDYFLFNNKELKEISLPKAEQIGDCFLNNNEDLKEISLPEAKNIGDYFLYDNMTLKVISLPKAKQIGDCFLYCNENLEEINLPNATKIGDNFLFNNKELKEISLPEAKNIGDYFLYNNKILEKINLPNATEIGDCFLYENIALKEICLTNATKIGYDFLYLNKSLKEINLPNATKIGHYFLFNNKELKDISLPKAEQIKISKFKKNEQENTTE